ncbi:hypothetical protein D3C86_1163710 [compost metagenome]
MVAEGIVDRFEAVQIDEHQGKAPPFFPDPRHGLIDSIGEQRPVRQPGEGVVQGQLGQFTVGLGQRMGQARGARLQACIEDRGQQGNAQHRQRGDQHQVVQAIAAQSIDRCATKTAVGKARGGHPGVVHADDGDAHDHGGTATDKTDIRRVLAQMESDRQCRARSTDSDQQRGAEQRRVVVDARLHAHGGHAGVVHRADAGAHDQRAKGQLPGRQLRLADQPQRKTAGEHADQQRQQGDGAVVPQVDRQLEREHADKVHRPDADAHGNGPARRPQMHGAAFGGGDAPGQVECGVGGENRYTERNDDQGGGIATDEHGDFSRMPPC